MRNALAVLALMLATAMPAMAQAPAAAGDDDSTLLHLTQSATREVAQDRLTIEIRADVTGADAAAVQAAVNRRMTTALERAKAAPSVRTETRGYWVQQERPANAPARWHGVETLALIGTDTAAVLKLAGTLQQEGLVMSRLSYDVAPDTARSIEDELTTTALQRLKDRVDRIAKDMGLVVRSFKALRVGNVSGNAPPRPFLMRAAAPAAATAPAPAAEPGEATLEVSVDADVVLSRNPP
ncbi:MAG: SIMPL domain-containing protein [Alphaproteobacteria bacterium]|nr:SIMPL domain-containing protein [Alphaproteobacteria bacterium]